MSVTGGPSRDGDPRGVPPRDPPEISQRQSGQGAGRCERGVDPIPLVPTVIAAVASLAVLTAWRLVTPTPRLPVCCDASRYLAMAARPARAVIEPYASRVLLPWTVHALGGGAHTFRMLTFLCLAACGPVCYLLARSLGAANSTALLAAVALESSRGFVFQLSDPWLSDPATLLLSGIVILALVRNLRPLALALLLVGLAATRELFIGFALPAWAWWQDTVAPLGIAMRLALVLTPALVVFLLIFAFAPHLASSAYRLTPSGVWQAMDRAVRVRIANDGGFVWLGSFATSLGVWWALFPAGLASAQMRHLTWWLVPVAATCLLGFDWSRYLLAAYPVVMPAGALALDAARRRSALMWLVLIQLPLPLADLLAHRLSLDGPPGPTLVLGSGLLIATAIVVLIDRPAFARARMRSARL